ncbi:MAG TPA: hypothetical protein VIN07_07040 [Flavipsychrobacter sp.]
MNHRNKNRGNAMQSGLEAGAKKMPVVDTSGRFKTKNKKHDTKIVKIRELEQFGQSRLFVQF